MRRILTILAAFALTSACASQPAANSEPPRPAIREIALTFDDSPTPNSHLMTGRERTDRLIAALAAADVHGAMIFAVGERAASEEGQARLAAFARAGHVIANHSNTHRSANRLSAEEFLADVRAADSVLEPLPGFKPYFRFPYLAAGETLEARDALRQGLAVMGYRHGYITVDAWDWHMASRLDEAITAGHAIDWERLRATYVDVTLRSIEHYDALARRTLGRSPRHVMLMHENDLNALYIADVAAALRARGWRIISAERAFNDPIARIDPESLRLGGGQIVAMADAAGGDWRTFDSGLTSAEALDALLEPALGRPATAQ